MANGNIKNVETSGASWETAQQDGPNSAGVQASHKMAQTDAGRMAQYKTIIQQVARNKGVDSAVIAAIISRESRAGNTIRNTSPPGWGDHGKGFGLMQVDVTPTGGKNKPEGQWDSEEHLNHATGILVHFINLIKKKFSTWSAEQQLKGAIAAYNMGEYSVESYEGVDQLTTGKDYSNDVVARAQWYKEQGY